MSYNNRNVYEVIDKFNSTDIQTVIERVAGVTFKNKSCKCPIHKGDNPYGASIDKGRNVFSCWTGDCGKGISPFNFVKKYYGLNTFKETAIKINEIFNANIPIYNKGYKLDREDLYYDTTYKVNKYLSEVEGLLEKEISSNHILLNANTGMGKTYTITKILNKYNGLDYNFLFVPTRSIAEQVAADYPFSIFYGDEIMLPAARNIVCTFHKAAAVERKIDEINQERALNKEIPLMFSINIDECHVLMQQRNLLGKNVFILEQLIKNSEQSLLMSANTDFIYKAYKYRGIFNKYIGVIPLEVNYNSDNLNIFRLPCENSQKVSYVTDYIERELNTYNNVLFQEDSIVKLQEYNNILKLKGIDSIIIDSKGKTEDEAALKSYEEIIENSKLNKKVILTTSLINAGVNIKQENISLIIKQDYLQFDTQKIIQFLSRVRTKNNNLTLMLGSTEKEQLSFITSIDKHIRVKETSVYNSCNEFNEYIFNKYGLDVTDEIVKNEWGRCKTSKIYEQVSSCLYLENGLLKVDYVAAMEDARLSWERENYYNNKFILEQLKYIKAKNISKPIAIKEVETKKIPETNSGEVLFTNDLRKILEDASATEELYKYISKDLTKKDLTNELVIDFQYKYNRERKYKTMLSKIRSCLCIKDSNISHISIFYSICNEYASDKKSCEIEENVMNIIRREIYNKMCPIGCSNEDIDIIKDYIYTSVRFNCDCYVEAYKRSHTKPKNYNRLLDQILEYYVIIQTPKEELIIREPNEMDRAKPIPIYSKPVRKGSKREKQYVIINNKEVEIKKVKKEIINCMESIYEITDSYYITELK